MDAEYMKQEGASASGIYILGVAIVAFIIYKFVSQRSPQNTVSSSQDVISLEEARRRMQEKLDKAAQEARLKQTERAATNSSSVGSSNLGGPSKPETPEVMPPRRRVIPASERVFRSDYNPLTGHSGSSGYRPSKRSCGPAKGG